MNKLAKKWVEALRSGHFKQGREVLYSPDDDTYCCLGVACVVAEENGVDVYWDPEEGSFVGAKEMTQRVRLPTIVKDALKLRSNIGSYSLSSLANDNDERGFSFEEIADIIESEPEGLFNE